MALNSGGPSPWGNPRPGGPWGTPPPGPPGGGRGPGGPGPDLDDLIRRAQDWVRGFLRTPRGGGSGRAAALLALLVLGVWAASGIYRVQPDEEGVVLRFGAYHRNAPPGLNYHIPWPVETALTPRVTTENLVFIGFRSADASAPRAGAGRDVREESLMLTGDENIIDIDFVVRWRVRDASEFLFNTRNPENTIKSAAESMMREVIGRTPIQPALTEARAQIETQVAQGTQAILDQYKAGVVVTQVQLQKVDPPSEVIEAFRDVQRAAADKERSRNEAEAYRNDIIPRARGEAERMIQEAQGYRDSQEARAKGEATRFVSVLGAYRQAQDITMRRLYLETMEDILRRNPKVIVDDRLQGLVPFLNLTDPPARGGSRPAPSSPPTLPSMPRGAQTQGGTR
ncbi:FtsH protease activity modulator HflK [Belnapia sp. T18]|uniref:Protein HflK n=1 Tax=Belnapia arida TaxID=2804533 RepID=A0ABS1U295_9PROT|nr:FtsH protease activity modulator HflK [Belnapia arida]MBL6078786.1 FtsH protease activity modulator HflK [Belnapia arida]